MDGINLTLREGESVGVVGESGSGKSTLGLALLRLVQSQGEIVYDGTSIEQFRQKQMLPLRREMQVVFQDPFGSLSPRMPVARIVGEGLEVHGIGDETKQEEDVISALKEWGLIRKSVTDIPMNSPEANVKESPLPVHWCSNQGSSSLTNRHPPSIARSNSRFWNYLKNCKKNTDSAISSSVMTSR